MIRLHFPPPLVDCDDAFSVAIEVAASQIHNPGATIFVSKGLTDEKNGKVHSSSFITQGRRTVGFEGNHKMLVQAMADEGRVSLAENQLSASTQRYVT